MILKKYFFICFLSEISVKGFGVVSAVTSVGASASQRSPPETRTPTSFCACLRWLFSEKSGQCIDKSYACCQASVWSKKSDGVATKATLALNGIRLRASIYFFRFLWKNAEWDHKSYACCQRELKIKFDDFFKNALSEILCFKHDCDIMNSENL